MPVVPPYRKMPGVAAVGVERVVVEAENRVVLHDVRHQPHPQVALGRDHLRAAADWTWQDTTPSVNKRSEFCLHTSSPAARAHC